MAEKESPKPGNWFSRQISLEEFTKFVHEAINSLDNAIVKRAYIGDVTVEAAQRIKAVCGKTMGKIMVDNGQIRHAYKKLSHNLEADDIFHIIDVINTAPSITLSDKKFLHNPALVFEKDISGNITFLVQVRVEYGGWLAFADCWRKNKKDKAGDAPMLPFSPPKPSSETQPLFPYPYIEYSPGRFCRQERRGPKKLLHAMLTEPQPLCYGFIELSKISKERSYTWLF
jgi:hypothetical protein